MLKVYCWPGGKYGSCKCNCGAKNLLNVNEKLAHTEIIDERGGSPCNRLLRPLRWVEVQLYPIKDLGTEDGGRVSAPRSGRFTSGKDPVPIVQEAGWAQGPVWTGAESLAPHRDSIPGPSSP